MSCTALAGPITCNGELMQGWPVYWHDVSAGSVNFQSSTWYNGVSSVRFGPSLCSNTYTVFVPRPEGACEQNAGGEWQDGYGTWITSGIIPASNARTVGLNVTCPNTCAFPLPTATPIPVNTFTPTPTYLPGMTATHTPTNTPTRTVTPGPSPTPTRTPTVTPTGGPTPTATPITCVVDICAADLDENGIIDSAGDMAEFESRHLGGTSTQELGQPPAPGEGVYRSDLDFDCNGVINSTDASTLASAAGTICEANCNQPISTIWMVFDASCWMDPSCSGYAAAPPKNIDQIKQVLITAANMIDARHYIGAIAEQNNGAQLIIAPTTDRAAFRAAVNGVTALGNGINWASTLSLVGTAPAPATERKIVMFFGTFEPGMPSTANCFGTGYLQPPYCAAWTAAKNLKDVGYQIYAINAPGHTVPVVPLAPSNLLRSMGSDGNVWYLDLLDPFYGSQTTGSILSQLNVLICSNPTATPTSVATSTPTPTSTRTPTPTRTPTVTVTPTITPFGNATATRTPTPTATRTPTVTPTATRTPTALAQTPTPTRTPTAGPSPTPTRTPTATPVALPVCLMPTPVPTVVVNISQEGTNFVPMQDTTLCSSAPTTNFGTTSTLSFKPNCTVLLKWTDLQRYRGKTVISATLRLFVLGEPVVPLNPDGPRYYIGWPVLPKTTGTQTVSWNELASTWTLRVFGQAWNTPGARGSMTDIDTRTAATFVNIKPGWVEAELWPALVQLWIDDPEHNYGFALENVSAGVEARVASSEWFAEGFRPQLELVLE